VCNRGKGILPGKKAFCARRSITEETSPIVHITSMQEASVLPSVIVKRNCFVLLLENRCESLVLDYGYAV
jgi:hypothetical protein